MWCHNTQHRWDATRCKTLWNRYILHQGSADNSLWFSGTLTWLIASIPMYKSRLAHWSLIGVQCWVETALNLVWRECDFHTIDRWDKMCELCVRNASCKLPTYYLRYFGYVSCVIEREDYYFLFFLNISMIFQREYNRVLVPTPGWIEQNQWKQFTQDPNQYVG